MLRKLLLTGIFVLSSCLFAFAQSGSITGTVTDSETGEPVISANIFIGSISRGAATDANGEYTIQNLEPGTYTVRVSYVGYDASTRDVEVESGENTADFQLDPALIGLDDVVVTAQGIERDKRSLGYSVSTVGSEAVEKQGETDITRALRGKVPGVEITQTSGVSGTGTNFIIRGFSSINGSNQPLFIVDGVQFDISTNQGSNFFDGGALSTASRFLDIDQSNVESISVLKGLSATTIYGEEGRNGVVLISTKSGSFTDRQEPGFEVSISQSLFSNTIANLPETQDTYGGGFHQNFGFFFSNWGPAFDRDLTGELPESILIRFDEETGRNILRHPFNFLSDDELRNAFPEVRDSEYPYQAYDNLEPFFRNGLVSKTNLNISGGTQGANLNLSVGRSNDEGFTPGNTVDRTNVSLGGNFQVTDNLIVRATANVALTDFETPPIAPSFGSSSLGTSRGSVFSDVFYTPRSVDLNGIPFQTPVSGRSIYYRSGNDIQHPLWTVNNVRDAQDTDRLFGKAEASYDIMEGLNVTYKLGLDTYTDNQSFQLNEGGVINPDLVGGYYQTRSLLNTIWDNNFLVNYETDLTQSFSLNGTVGAQYVIEKFEADGIGSQDQVIFDFFEHGNFTTPSASNFFSGQDLQFRIREETAGVFGEATVGYNDYIYLNLSGRNDWFSVLETDNRSIFYPSASVSFVPTDAFGISSDGLNFLKIRAGVGTSANAPIPYSTRTTLNSNPRDFVDAGGAVITSNGTSNQLGNRDLEPSLLIEYEAGVESRFWNNKLGLEVTGYFRQTNDLITNATLDPAVGFSQTLTNIGELQNRGLEIALNFSPLNGPFQWSLSTNFTAQENEVTELTEGLEQIQINGFGGGLGNYAVVGEPFQVIQATAVQTDDQGRRIVNPSTGVYDPTGSVEVIGDPNPDFDLSFINAFNYKNFSLNTQFDYRKGGDLYSLTIATLLGRGIAEDTDFDRQVPVILPGVDPDGNPNTTQITATQAGFRNISSFFGLNDLGVYDATVYRLSEVSLSYNLPGSVLSQTPLKQVSLTLSGFNLWHFAPNTPEGINFDPNVLSTGVGNGRGFDFLAGPTSRRFGGTISVNF